MSAPIERHTECLSVEAHPNGRARCPVLIWQLQPRERLVLNDVNLASQRERAELLESVPTGLRTEALPLLEDVATELVRLRMAPSWASKGQGSPLVLADPASWPSPVALESLLQALAALFHRFLILPCGAADALALWTVGSYCIATASLFPKLAILSATKRCGKTRLLSLLDAVTHRPLSAANITAAVLFRAIEECTPTLLLDEADQFLAAREELIGIMNAGHTRRTAYVVRSVGEDHIPSRFSVFCPQAIACVGKLPTDTLADRAITIAMPRKAPGEVVDRWREDQVTELGETLRRQALRWAADHPDVLRDPDPLMPPGLHDRAEDNWRPLVALADDANSEWGRRARSAAALLSKVVETDDMVEVLLADLYALFTAAAGHEKLPTSEILPSLHDMDERPYAEWGRLRKPITAVGLAQALRRFGIRPKLKRDGNEVFRATSGRTSSSYGDGMVFKPLRVLRWSRAAT